MSASNHSPVDHSAPRTESPTGPLVVIQNDSAEGAIESEEHASDYGPLLDYLQTQEGHEIASRVIALLENLQKSAGAKGVQAAKWDRVIQVGIIATVLLCATILAVVGKFTNEVGIVFVALLGYTLKKPS